MMVRNSIVLGAVVMAASWAATASAAIRDCRAIVDPAARLACYDQAAGQAPVPRAAPVPRVRVTPPENQPLAAAPLAAPAPAAQPVPQYVESEPQVTNLKNRPDFDTRIAAVIPLRHGYYRLQFEDGSAYNTTEEGTRPNPGDTVHIRRTFLGTTYMDRDGMSPVAIKLARQQ